MVLSLVVAFVFDSFKQRRIPYAKVTMAEEAAEVKIDDDGGGFEAAAVSRSSHRRPDHMSELVRIRRESMRLLFPTGTGDIDEDKADDKADDENKDNEQGEELQLDPVGNLHMFKEALELDSPFVRRLQELFPNTAKTNGDKNIDSDLKYPTIEIRLQNVNYKVPIQVVDADDDGIKTIVHAWRQKQVFKTYFFQKLIKMSKFVLYYSYVTSHFPGKTSE